MAMAVDSQQRHHLGSMGAYSHLAYQQAAPHFHNPWSATSSGANAGPHLFPTPLSSSASAASSSHMEHDYLSKQTVSRVLPYATLPAAAASSTYASSYSQPEQLMGQSHDMLGAAAARPTYEASYTSAPSQPIASYASGSGVYSGNPMPMYGQSLAPHDGHSRRLSSASAVSQSHSHSSFGDAIEASRGMVAMSQQDITPRNIYGPRSHRGSMDSYGFPSTHSSASSSAGNYPHYYASSVTDSTDYSSASESLDGLNSRTLPRPTGLLGGGLPPAPQSMMGSFNSKVSSSTQKKHKCKICDKRFTRPSSLQTHMYSHTGEKPFQCEVPGCGRNFSVVSNLRRHRKVHKGDRVGSEEHDHGSPEGSWASSSRE